MMKKKWALSISGTSNTNNWEGSGHFLYFNAFVINFKLDFIIISKLGYKIIFMFKVLWKFVAWLVVVLFCFLLCDKIIEFS